MKKLITLMFVGMFLTCTLSSVNAQTSSITASNLPADVKGIIANVKRECGLNPTQTTKFTNDYVAFLNNNSKNLAVNAANASKRDEETRKLLLQTGAKFRSYLNDGQFTKLSQMIQAGKLDPAKFTGSVTTDPAQAPVQLVSNPASGPLIPASVSVQSNVAGIFQQLSGYMNVTADQNTKALPILKEYDQQAETIKKNNAPGKRQQLLDALNAQTIQKLKPNLNDDQIGKLIIAVNMQENILSGRNLSTDQKTFLEKLRNQYGLNDVQTMAVVLVMVEGKIRGDAINMMAKSNPQGAAQELGKLLQDLDGRLKSALSADQYTKVKADIEKMIRGQRV